MGCVKSKAEEPPASRPADPEQKKVDPELPFTNYREFYTLKNYWKAVDRKRDDSGQLLILRFFTQNPEHLNRYPKLKDLELTNSEALSNNSTFEATASAYLQVFDDVINAVESNPADASQACDRLSAVGKQHKSKMSGVDSGAFQAMEEPFLHMISTILEDRYNDKAENLFRKFFQFCLKYIVQGYNS